MLDRSRLTPAERDVLIEALRARERVLVRRLERSASPRTAANCRWRHFVVAELLAELDG